MDAGTTVVSPFIVPHNHSHGHGSEETPMRYLVLILAILGAAAFGFIGLAARSGLEEAKASEAGRIGLQLKEGQDVTLMVYSLLAAAPLALVAGVLAFLRKKWLAIPLLLIVAAVPDYFAFQVRSLDTENKLDLENKIV